ncbi:hypothetical protein BN59_01092 [Legionella massiliensis]|uniref:Uncharacterized protein n=1 Tax=Legionella massiliensis TaxID=1034943 RepID=A0A078KUU2_9GAMM|nr:hypothetical protein [Legionella massiliensis]CDZ76816.1 hypothetical protein BN59_01092 [Legionella massiliensis]CEE12554.1 hypothetical protein BN1094_01092 [Legionella massiliensis]
MSFAKLDPKLIGKIDVQINAMIDQGHTNSDILNNLQQFAPVVLSMIERVEPKQLELYNNAYPGFRSYLALVLRKNWN